MGVAHMAEMGLETSVLAPVIVLLARRVRLPLDRLAVPAAAALPLFLGVHSAVTMTMPFREPPFWQHLGLHALLLAAGVIFWLPVLGGRRRLSEPGRMVYLYLAMPTMDLSGVYVVLRGDAAGGLAMIVAMLPVGLTAVAITWRWIVAEERAARATASLAEWDADERRQGGHADEHPGDVVTDVAGVQPA
ncbi:MAG TPA: hypothetical protein VFT62_01845 [Mycobacteriales bacterium]|nr:hypothetical protein [Mycobacteriales bacterium]